MHVFTASYGETTHDINYLIPLVESAQQTFGLHFLLVDKAYLSTATLDWLWEKTIRADIPLKKGWFRGGDRFYSEAIIELVRWFDDGHNRKFHGIYRRRPKIEALFSLLKRQVGEHVWSRRRRNETTKSEAPRTAWINETLYEFIYLNLHATVTLEKETGYIMNYLLPDLHSPAPKDPLLPSAA